MLHKTGHWNTANHVHQCERIDGKVWTISDPISFCMFHDQRQGTCPKQMGSLPQLRSARPTAIIENSCSTAIDCHNT